jgi:hypothetical protein
LTVPASKSSLKKLPPFDEELELLLEELLLEEELELLLDDELELEVPEEEELELLLDELEELLAPLDEEELELEELLLEVPSSPVQVGNTKLPSCVPRKPKTVVKVWPGWGNCQLNSLLNVRLVPQNGLAAGLVRITFQSLVQHTCSGQFKVTVQLLNCVVPVLLTLTSIWKLVPPLLGAATVQLYAANA